MASFSTAFFPLLPALPDDAIAERKQIRKRLTM